MYRQYKYELLSFYPHLQNHEIQIWERFIKTRPDFFELVDYDTTCGTGHELPDDLKEPWRSNARYLGKYKIDVVGYRRNLIFVCEIRPHAGPGTIGEVLSKAILLQQELGPGAETEPVIITDLERPDMRNLCIEHDIDYYVV